MHTHVNIFKFSTEKSSLTYLYASQIKKIEMWAQISFYSNEMLKIRFQKSEKEWNCEKQLIHWFIFYSIGWCWFSLYWKSPQVWRVIFTTYLLISRTIPLTSCLCLLHCCLLIYVVMYFIVVRCVAYACYQLLHKWITYTWLVKFIVWIMYFCISKRKRKSIPQTLYLSETCQSFAKRSNQKLKWGKKSSSRKRWTYESGKIGKKKTSTGEWKTNLSCISVM